MHRALGPVLLGCVLVLLQLGLGPAQADPRPVATLPSGVWPLSGAPQVLRRFDPPETRWDAAHRGVDLAATVDQVVRTAAAGTVAFAGELAGRGVVVVDHGAVRTTYEPVRAVVAVGRRVPSGATIGVIEADPPAPGHPSHCPARPCLHWGLRLGDTYLDPLLLLSDVAAPAGPVRLLGQDAVAAARRRAAARAVVAAAQAASGTGLVGLAGAAGPTGSGGPAPPVGAHGFALPAVGPVSSGFGMRLHPVLHVWKLHDGTDLAAPCGATLRAPAAGVVVGRSADAGYGNRLLIDHGVVDGRHVVTALNHASGYRVAVGTRVRRGEVVGAVGRTGYATGCHVHLMVWVDGVLVDPLTWF